MDGEQERTVRVGTETPSGGEMDVSELRGCTKSETAKAIPSSFFTIPLQPPHVTHTDRYAPLVQPEVLPGVVRHQVARPRVRNLVRDHVRQGTVPRQERGRREGQAGVLHLLFV